jgi:hypothetical protein
VLKGLISVVLLLLQLHNVKAEYVNEDAFNALLDDPNICGELHSKHDIEEFIYSGPYHDLLGNRLNGYWMVDAPVMPRDKQRCIAPHFDPKNPGAPVCVYHEPDGQHSNWYFIGCGWDNTIRPPMPTLNIA